MAERPRVYMGKSVLIRAMRHILRDRLTETGRSVFWLMLLANATGGYSFVIKIYMVISTMFSLVAVSVLLSRLSRVNLKLAAEWPSRTTCGARITVPLTVENPTRRAAVDVHVTVLNAPLAMDLYPETGLALPRVEPGDRLNRSLELSFDTRGHYVLEGLRQETSYPWGLWRDLKYHKHSHSILVYPQFKPIHRLEIPVGRRYQPGGIALTSFLGDSTEFLCTREYREGDPLRSIHWRSWARTGKPVVKEFQEEYFCRIALLLDTFLPPPKKRQVPDTTAFEAAVSLSAAVADRLAREEYVIDLFAAGPEIYHFQAGRSLAYLENVMDILACIEPCHDPPFEKIEPVMLDYLENITTTVVVLLDWDERRARMVRVIKDRGSAVRVFLVRQTPATLDPAGGADLAGEITVLTPEQVRQGVEAL
ncbi:MAG: DUF58 domain-containing protein [Candidatus Eremiobacterota bacterium]